MQNGRPGDIVRCHAWPLMCDLSLHFLSLVIEHTYIVNLYDPCQPFHYHRQQLLAKKKIRALQNVKSQTLCSISTGNSTVCYSVGKDFAYHACGHEFKSRLKWKFSNFPHHLWLLLSDYRGMVKWFGAHYNQEVRFSSAVKCKKRP